MEEFLKNISLFKELNNEQLSEISKILKPINFKTGEIIIVEGEKGNTMYIFKKGKVQITHQLTLKVESQHLEEGEKSMAILDAEKISFFGEMSLVTGSPRSATIKALSECELYEISKKDFENLAEKRPDIGYKIMKEISITLSRRIETLNENILKLTTALSIALSKKKK
ncbi:Cyclic nucleotide-binding domain-containing protein [Marinitoga hydrogenitolerans DSM 16785]|uniref:Cyclic nucleotide-binding domain-containing protein n=1 Tax=Marinitoga hydrogenitolerans (strain DSM 16785 / JCM 12826 / AT1271) TaxID=1122195 RepID=A0A1M4Z8M4_MARH1|nr:cyclic nucleotide-binding domain-containing protein [Marinitoga hydrogenitolerans]SHF14371.1 Cyclic nucleotide-binding domain-containing protein [Marinitoga hydrogenitolerans DSM 16785]